MARTNPSPVRPSPSLATMAMEKCIVTNVRRWERNHLWLALISLRNVNAGCGIVIRISMCLETVKRGKLTLHVTSLRNKFIIIIMMMNAALHVLVIVVEVVRLAREEEVVVVDALVAVRTAAPAPAPTVRTLLTTVVAALLLRTAGAAVGAGVIAANEMLGRKPT